MTREDLDNRLDKVRIEIRKSQDETLSLNDAAVHAEAAYRKRHLESLLKVEVKSLKGASEREAMAEEMARTEWLAWKLGLNKARYERERMENLRSEQSSLQTQARMLISEMAFEQQNWEP